MRPNLDNIAPLPAGPMIQTAALAPPRIAVVIASKGRPLEISYVLQALAEQTLKPTEIVLSVAAPADLPPHDDRIITIIGLSGLTRQRNRGMEAILGRSDIVVFFDDDFIPASNALAGIAGLFAANPTIAGASGLVLQDGVTHGGLDLPTARDRLHEFEARKSNPIRIRDRGWAYGCNMAFRTSAIGNIRFDENLPLYGWQEDVDFSMQLRRHGRIVKTNAFAGVHLGVNKSRSSGIPLGYSQVINPVYLVRKGTMSPLKAALLMARNICTNHLRSLAPESWIDRRGRAAGNRRAIADLLRGQVDPTAILRF